MSPAGRANDNNSVARRVDRKVPVTASVWRLRRGFVRWPSYRRPEPTNPAANPRRSTSRPTAGSHTLVQAAKARRGYRSVRNIVTMLHLIGGKPDFGLPA